MADNKNLGKVAITNGGDYRAETTYSPLTRVRHNSASWISKKETTGNEPSEGSEYWQLDCKDGKDGNQVNVINNLDSTSTTAALSAAQGKYLDAKIGAKVVITADDTTPPDDHSVLWVHG